MHSNGTKTHYGPTRKNISASSPTLEAADLGTLEVAVEAEAEQGGACASGSTSANKVLGGGAHRPRTAPVVAVSGGPDIGRSRASIGMMVAGDYYEVSADKVRTIVADTASIGFTHVTGSSLCGVLYQHGGHHGDRKRWWSSSSSAPR